MRNQAHIALQAMETAKSEVKKLAEMVEKLDPRHQFADDAFLAAGWGIKKLNELIQTIENGEQPTP